MEDIRDVLKDKILVLDGAMGTMIQQYKFTEEDYRGEKFKDFHISVKGNKIIKVLTWIHYYDFSQNIYVGII